MHPKQLLRKIQLLREAEELQQELKGLLLQVMEGSLRAACGEESARRDLKAYTQRLEELKAKSEELQAESETLDFLMEMGIQTQDD